jgi:hypothetical protein
VRGLAPVVATTIARVVATVVGASVITGRSDDAVDVRTFVKGRSHIGRGIQRGDVWRGRVCVADDSNAGTARGHFTVRADKVIGDSGRCADHGGHGKSCASRRQE